MSWGKYVGRDVWIEWRDPGDDWRWFHVIRVIDTRYGIASLRGIDTPRGDKHDGSEFNATWREVKRIKFSGDAA